MEIPIPKFGYTIQIPFKEETVHFVSPGSIFSLPSLTDFNISIIFELFSVEQIIQIIISIFLEEKILFVSSVKYFLCKIAEIFCSLLYPFSWDHLYIPFLPKLLLEFIYSPMPFITSLEKSLLDLIDPTVLDVYFYFYFYIFFKYKFK